MLALFLAISDEADRITTLNIYKRYSRQMYAIAMKILSDRNDAEDALMEAFKRIIANVKKFNDLSRDEVEGLVVIYIKNTSIDIYNANKRREKHLSYESKATAAAPSAEDVVILKNEVERLADAITKLPEQMSSALLLKYEYRFSYSEISTALGISESGVRSRISRAKAELRKIMNEEGCK